MASKTRSPSGEGSATANRTAKCLYCDEMKALDAFNREHVMPEAFGKYEDNLVLRDRVCWDCNDYFGRTLDLPLARDSKEGLDRFVHGLVRPKPGRTVGTKIALRQRGGAFDGAILDWELDSRGILLSAKPARQVGFARSEVGPFDWHRVEDLPSIEALRAGGIAYGVAGGLGAEEAAAIFETLGLQVTEPVVLGDPRDADGMLDTTMEGKIDATIRRAIAKIAFNYLAYHYAEIASLEQFRAIRRYVRFAEEPGGDPVTVLTQPVLGGLPPTVQLIGHVITTKWDDRAHEMVAQVSLFNWVQYRVLLSTSPFFFPPFCVDSGHLFNPYAKEVVQLTSDPKRAGQVPLMTKDEFRMKAPDESPEARAARAKPRGPLDGRSRGDQRGSAPRWRDSSKYASYADDSGAHVSADYPEPMFDFDIPDRTPRENAEAAITSLEAWHAKVIRYWADGARGWAPEVASEILARSRLDRQASLCACLRLWVEAPRAGPQADGYLVLAWANLGSVVEGSMKFFLSVFAHDYANGTPIARRGRAMDPDELGFEQLRQFFNRDVWLPEQRTWDNWLEAIQHRRNAIHAYRDREVGTHDEFLAALVGFSEFAEVLDGQVPWS